jgi:hypothetical protein
LRSPTRCGDQERLSSAPHAFGPPKRQSTFSISFSRFDVAEAFPFDPLSYNPEW